jgi:transcriptional regulator with XRE-family HTH domain
MAKKMVHPRPGALKELLEKRELTQEQAANREVVGLDRKTLRKIDRGEEVKLETLEDVAKRLRVSLGHFLGTTEADDKLNDPPAHTVMLRRLNGERLAELLKRVPLGGRFQSITGDQLEWLLNVQVVDEKASKLLNELERAASQSRVIPSSTAAQAERVRASAIGWPPAVPVTDSLSAQLQRVTSLDRLGDILKELHECRLAVLGGDYLYWVKMPSSFRDEFGHHFSEVTYRSFPKVLLSIDPSSTRSRRVPIFPGFEPPKFAPNAATIVTVDGRRLDTAEPPISKPDFGRTHAKRKK